MNAKMIASQCHVQTESLCAGFCGTRITKYMGWCGTKRELVIPEQSQKMIATEFSSPDLMSLMSSMASFLPQLSFTINTCSKVRVTLQSALDMKYRPSKSLLLNAFDGNCLRTSLVLSL